MNRAAIFDMDGILIFSEHGHYLAFQEVAKLKLKHELSLEEYRLHFVGKTDADGWESLCKYYHLTYNLPVLLKEVSDAYLARFEQSVEPNWPVVNVLKEIALIDILVGITSSSSQREVNKTIRALNLSSSVSAVVSADEVSAGKPDPEPYLLTAQRLHIAPNRSVVIEDSSAGIESAIAAGMKCIALTTTHPRTELARAHVVLDTLTLADILNILPEEL